MLGEIEGEAARFPPTARALPRRKIVSAITTRPEQNEAELSVAASFDGKTHTNGRSTRAASEKSQAAIFNFRKNPVGYPSGTRAHHRAHFNHPNSHHVMGRPRLSISFLARARDFTGHEVRDPSIAATFAAPRGGRIRRAAADLQRRARMGRLFAAGVSETGAASWLLCHPPALARNLAKVPDHQRSDCRR